MQTARAVLTLVNENDYRSIHRRPIMFVRRISSPEQPTEEKAKPDGQHYVAQIVNKCLQPAASGSYTWTIPDKYSGASFRIYAVAPGRMSSAFGPGFAIVKAEPKPQ
jgi:hypothetical protein